MHKQKLVLFDIDGTLMTLEDVADRAFRAMTEEVYGIACSFLEISFSGKTDPQILEEVLKLRGVKHEIIWGRYKRAYESYCTYFDYFVNQDGDHVQVFPGVDALLGLLKQEKGVWLGILTGNLEYTAWKKLELAGLKKYFPFGAFGSDAKDRSALVGIALQRAKRTYGYAFSKKNVAIIGDSPNDVACGRSYGVKSIAVATGQHSMAELKKHKPDYLFQDLRAHGEIMQAILMT